ncbi:AMP-binding protein [Actinophytocola sp.]|uniref:AMP-binding protein n=1 Tax=Actinophytocola sp. TaxID=1872138 RepID=UPI002D59E471|nr:AMP-binding protein [Actinophytocola sp.]HYQ67828.1 AMP-binding protein [Actinophytocola sp.]
MSTVDYRFDYATVGFLDTAGLTAELTGAELTERGRSAAAGLAHNGIGFQDRVIIVEPTGPDYLAVLLGCLLSGVVPATVAAPPKPDDPTSAGARHLRAAIDVIRPAAVITSDTRLAASVPVLTVDDLRRHGRAPWRTLRRPEPGQWHHIQLTSGSTSAPKAAVLTHANVAANLHALHAAFALAPHRDRVTSWLPLYHDMGLMLMLIGLTAGACVDLMPPTSFVRDPVSWLRHMADRRTAVTSAPPFAYRVAADRFKGATDLDLSALRQAYVGAEPIAVGVLRHFQDTFSEYGLAEDTLAPCYGMAETVVATTLCQTKHATTDTSFGRVRWQEFQAPSRDELQPTRQIVSCGQSIEGLTLRVDAPDGEVGEIEVGGSSVMAGYLTTEGLNVPPGGFHDTGDLGMVVDGELYVVGRTKEMLIVRGRNIPPYDIERTIEEHPAASLAAVFSYHGDTTVTEQVVAVVETRAKPGEWPRLRTEVATAVRQAFGLSLADVVVLPRGGIPRTTSGKRQRQAVRAAYLSGG